MSIFMGGDFGSSGAGTPFKAKWTPTSNQLQELQHIMLFQGEEMALRRLVQMEQAARAAGFEGFSGDAEYAGLLSKIGKGVKAVAKGTVKVIAAPIKFQAKIIKKVAKPVARGVVKGAKIITKPVAIVAGAVALPGAALVYGTYKGSKNAIKSISANSAAKSKQLENKAVLQDKEIARQQAEANAKAMEAQAAEVRAMQAAEAANAAYEAGQIENAKNLEAISAQSYETAARNNQEAALSLVDAKATQNAANDTWDEAAAYEADSLRRQEDLAALTLAEQEGRPAIVSDTPVPPEAASEIFSDMKTAVNEYAYENPDAQFVVTKVPENASSKVVAEGVPNSEGLIALYNENLGIVSWLKAQTEGAAKLVGTALSGPEMHEFTDAELEAGVDEGFTHGLAVASVESKGVVDAFQNKFKRKSYPEKVALSLIRMKRDPKKYSARKIEEIARNPQRKNRKARFSRPMVEAARLVVTPEGAELSGYGASLLNSLKGTIQTQLKAGAQDLKAAALTRVSTAASNLAQQVGADPSVQRAALEASEKAAVEAAYTQYIANRDKFIKWGAIAGAAGLSLVILRKFMKGKK